MHREAAQVVQDLETLPGGPAHVVMHDEHIDGALHREEVPGARPHSFTTLLVRAAGLVAELAVRGRPLAAGHAPEVRRRLVRVVTTDVRPQHDRRADVDPVARDDDRLARGRGPELDR